MKMTASLTETIKRAMEPLTNRFGLRLREESESMMTAEVLFANDVTAMRVTVDWSEFRPFVNLYQLEGGHLPLSTSVALALRENLREFDADTLLTVRAESASPVGKMFGARSAEAAFVLLSEYASALDQHASDVLSGDFTVFAMLEERVRKRRDAQR